MSNDTNFIDFLHDHYSTGTTNDVSRTIARLQQHLEQQRKLILNEIASVKDEDEEQLKSIVSSINNEQQYSDNEK